MAAVPVHSRILTEAARRALGPLEVRQRGRSRTWLDDRGWWLIFVEFQPSSWSKGSYLNVGAMWLWQLTDYLSFDFSFDLGARVEGYKEFRDERSFAADAEQLAQRAATEVLRYRAQFPDMGVVADVLQKHANVSKWSRYHAAMAAALADRAAVAFAGFSALADEPAETSWQRELRAVAGELRAILRSPDAFQSRVATVVRETRALLKLPRWDGTCPRSRIAERLPDINFEVQQ